MTIDKKDYDKYKERYFLLKFSNIKGKKFLDVGAGKGLLSIIAAKEFDCDVTCIDPFESTLRIAKDNAEEAGLKDAIAFVKGDATKLPFKNNYFDVVACFNALHHIPKDKRKRAVEEMFRTAKEKLLIAELNNKGIELFDKYLLPEMDHASMRVDLKWLEEELKNLGEVKKDKSSICNFYCAKKRQKVMKNRNIYR